MQCNAKKKERNATDFAEDQNLAYKQFNKYIYFFNVDSF